MFKTHGCWQCKTKFSTRQFHKIGALETPTCPNCGHEFDVVLVKKYMSHWKAKDRYDRNKAWFKGVRVISFILHFTGLISVPTLLPAYPQLYFHIAIGLAAILTVFYIRKGGNFLYCAFYSVAAGPLTGLYLAVVGPVRRPKK